MKKAAFFLLAAAVSLAQVAGQTKSDYASPDDSAKTAGPFGLFDPSRLTVSHRMSMGMMSGGASSSIQSQSFYSTMLQYRFAAPVTLNLNFSLPIHSTYSPYQNLTARNMQSLNYFKSVPFDVSLSWKPSERFFFNFSVVNYPSYYGSDLLGNGLMAGNGRW